MENKTVFDKQKKLQEWLGKDISTWSSKRIHAVYASEVRKRTKVYMKDLYS